MCKCISDIGSNAIEKFDRALKTGTQADAKTAHEAASSSRLYAVAVLAASIFLAVLGIALCATGVGTGFGIALLMISAPAFYVSYNSYKTLTNMKKMIDDVQKQNQNPLATPQQISMADIKKDLKAGTFLFDWIIEPKVEKAFYGNN